MRFNPIFHLLQFVLITLFSSHLQAGNTIGVNQPPNRIQNKPDRDRRCIPVLAGKYKALEKTSVKQLGKSGRQYRKD